MPRPMFDELTDDEIEEATEPAALNGHGRPSVVSLREMIAREREAELDVLGLRLRVRYDPSLVSDATDRRIQQLSRSGDELAAPRVFCQIVKAWDLHGPLTAIVDETDEDGNVLFDDDGNPLEREEVIVPEGQVIPLRPDVIQHLPSEVFLAIWVALREDAYGVPTNRRSRRQSRRR